MVQHQRALAEWQEKLELLLEAEPLETDPASKHRLRKQIAEARAKIAELIGSPGRVAREAGPAGDGKSVFIAYRRDPVGKPQARLLKRELERHGWDVFLDVDSIDAGRWEQQIETEIRRRPHFILLLTPGALDRCVDAGDFLRREYELAVEIGRDVVPAAGEDYLLAAEKTRCPGPMLGVFDWQTAALSHRSFAKDVETLAERYLVPRKRVVDLAAQRREAALAKFRSNLGTVLTGADFDLAGSLLRPEGPLSAEAQELLGELEALDGTPRMQRAVKALLLELAPAAATARVAAPEARTPPRPKAEPPADPVAGTPWQSPSGLRFRFVPGGTYWIGSPEDEPGRSEDEARHQVRLTRGFWMAETPLTQKQWTELAGASPSEFIDDGDDRPVEQVSWFEAVAVANVLSKREGLEPCYELVGSHGQPGTGGFTCESVRFLGFDRTGYRLPTEAEWEVAARAGTGSALYTGGITLDAEGKTAPELEAIAWYGNNSGGKTQPVGKKRANRWGLHDMLGNVWEWVWDWHGSYPSQVSDDPLGPPEGSARVIRGGSWLSHAQSVRAAYRYWYAPGHRYSALGFRFARGQGRGAPGAEPLD